MTVDEAAAVIEAMANSLRTNPNQFHVNLSIVGTRATSHGGGIGLSVTATGGGPGSHTVGFQSSASMGSAEISLANGAMQAEIVAIVSKLDEIVTELRKPKPDRSLLKRLASTVAEKGIGAVTAAAASKVVALALA